VLGFLPVAPIVVIHSSNLPSVSHFTTVINGHLSALRTPALRESIWQRPKEAFLKEQIHTFVSDKAIKRKLNKQQE
jgi:hypothetical protein